MNRIIVILALIILISAGAWFFIQPDSTVTPASTDTSIQGGGWTFSQPDARGIRFEYPRALGTTYVTVEEWPPKVTLVAGEYSCAEQDEHMVDDRSYCLVKSSEGAAGSTYTTYRYITGQGDFLANVEFTVRTPQCMNYDEPTRTECINEQQEFASGLDRLIDRIALSIRMN